MSQFVVAAIGNLNMLLTARILGPEGFGQLSLIILYSFFMFGIVQVSACRGIAVLSGQNKIRNSLALLPTLSLVSFAMLLPVSYLVITFSIDDPGLIDLSVLLFLSVVPCLLFTAFAESLWQGRGDFNRYNILLITEQAAYLFLLGLLWLSGHLNLAAVIVITVLTAVISAGVVFAMLIREWSGFDLKSTTDEILSVMKKGYVFMPLVIAGMLAYQGDNILLSKTMDARYLGFWGAYIHYVTSCIFIVGGICAGVFHLSIVGRDEDFLVIVKKTAVRYALVVALLVAAGQYAIDLLYGEEYMQEIGALWMVGVGYYFFAIGQVLGEYLQGKVIVRAGIIGDIASVAVLFGLFLLVFDFLGFAGFCLSFMLSEMVRLIIYGGYVARLNRRTVRAV